LPQTAALPANPKLLTAGESGDHENTKERKHETMNPDSFFVFSTFRVFVILRFPGVTRIGGQSPNGAAGSLHFFDGDLVQTAFPALRRDRTMDYR
jgi:hypothetical protein